MTFNNMFKIAQYQVKFILYELFICAQNDINISNIKKILILYHIRQKERESNMEKNSNKS